MQPWQGRHLPCHGCINIVSVLLSGRYVLVQSGTYGAVSGIKLFHHAFNLFAKTSSVEESFSVVGQGGVGDEIS